MYIPDKALTAVSSINKLWVCLDTVYFIKIEKLLLKVR